MARGTLRGAAIAIRFRHHKSQTLLASGGLITSNILRQVLKDATFDTETFARQRVPVITGRLQDSIKAVYNEVLMTGLIGSDVNYAGKIEYGSNNEYAADANIPGSKSGFKPYLRPSMKKAIIIANKKINKMIKKSGL